MRPWRYYGAGSHRQRQHRSDYPRVHKANGLRQLQKLWGIDDSEWWSLAMAVTILRCCVRLALVCNGKCRQRGRRSGKIPGRLNNREGVLDVIDKVLKHEAPLTNKTAARPATQCLNEDCIIPEINPLHYFRRNDYEKLSTVGALLMGFTGVAMAQSVTVDVRVDTKWLWFLIQSAFHKRSGRDCAANRLCGSCASSGLPPHPYVRHLASVGEGMVIEHQMTTITINLRMPDRTKQSGIFYPSCEFPICLSFKKITISNSTKFR